LNNTIPRWRGFNLLEAFSIKSTGNFKEEDFLWMAQWDFNFVRIPMCYLLWSDWGNPFIIREDFFEKIDRVIFWGEKYGIHICISLHRAPGYSVNKEVEEKTNLWKDETAQEAFIHHWSFIARRYKGISSTHLSFNLINEPPFPDPQIMSVEDHNSLIKRTITEIRKIDPERLIMIDGLGYGNIPVDDLTIENTVQSCRGYIPFSVTHYKAEWVDSKDFPAPEWPNGWHFGEYWNREKLLEHYLTWIKLRQKGIEVFCGEMGAYNKTPHDVVLKWLEDLLEIFKTLNIGFALWNFRGPFGILDSERKDVEYEEWYGHKLDRKMLELLRKY
jgi:endoglucanase